MDESKLEDQLKKLSKEELFSLSKDLLFWQRKHYEAAERGEPLNSAFYQLSGNFQSIRERNNLPTLYKD